MTDQERLMTRAREAWQAAAPSEGEIQRGAERVGRRLTARTTHFPRRPILISVGACAAFLVALAYAAGQKWIEPPRARHVDSQPTAAPSVALDVPAIDPSKINTPSLGLQAAPTSPAIDEAVTSPPESLRASETVPAPALSGARRQAPAGNDTASQTSWAEVSEALSGGDEKHAQSLLSDLARRGQNADDRAKAKLGLAQLEASHGNCTRARVLALQVAAVQGIELKTVRRALELATQCTQ
jgi:hypothetical protein